MNLEKKISDLIEQNLIGPEHFLVKVKVNGSSGKVSKISILVDTDTGLTITDCTHYSRLISSWLDEHNPIESKYDLEVSSPGIDFPLQSVRQFQKNINRKVELFLKEGVTKTGQLLQVSDQEVLLLEEKKEKKKVTTAESTIPFTLIEKALVQISFK